MNFELMKYLICQNIDNNLYYFHFANFVLCEENFLSLIYLDIIIMFSMKLIEMILSYPVFVKILTIIIYDNPLKNNSHLQTRTIYD